MQRDAIFTASLVLALGHASGCSVLFDPAQYSVQDADGLDARATDPDAPDPGELDAFVEPGVDADLDAHVALDAGSDASFDGASYDAGPDAPPPVFCPETPTSSTLPTCASPTRLAHCSPEDPGALLGFPRETAVAMLGEGSAGHRFGFLGNAIDLTDALPAGVDIVDHELVRVGDTVTAVWAQNGSRQSAVRRSWTVGSPSLGVAELINIAPLSASRLIDVTIDDSNEVALTYEPAGVLAQAARCPAGASCARVTPQQAPTESVAWVATTDSGFALAAPHGAPRLEFELFGSTLSGIQNLDRPALDAMRGIRPTHLAAAYTEGVDGQFLLDFTNGFATAVALPAPRPRITVADVTRHGLIGVPVAGMGRISVGTGLLRCDAGTACSWCTGEACALPLPTESTIATDLPIVDWSFHNVDAYHRVAVLLLGSALDGTNVVVAMWSVAGSPPTPIDAPPVVIASGRLGSGPGVGRSVRSVVTRDADSGRMEVFVTALVSLDGTDHIFLSGMRLLRCGT